MSFHIGLSNCNLLIHAPFNYSTYINKKVYICNVHPKIRLSVNTHTQKKACYRPITLLQGGECACVPPGAERVPWLGCRLPVSRRGAGPGRGHLDPARRSALATGHHPVQVTHKRRPLFIIFFFGTISSLFCWHCVIPRARKKILCVKISEP